MEVEKVGDGHLSDSEHAAPSAVRVVVGGGDNFGDFGAVGHEDVLFLSGFVSGFHFGTFSD